MIKQEELMIGNYVLLDECNLLQVSMISEDEISLDGEGYYDLRQISPVKLTEEWLIKFGWVLADDTFNELNYYYLSYKIDFIIVVEEGFILYAITWWNYLGHTMMIRESDPYYELIELKSVHQFQNLNFALTGFELKVKS